MYRQALALSAALCGFVLMARPQGSSFAWTADQFVQAALNKNRDYLSAQQRIREAQSLLTQGRVGIPDSLNITTSAGQVFGNSGEDSLAATYSHTFETFGKRKQRITVAEKEVVMDQAEVDERRRALVFEIKTRYADAAAAQLKLQLIGRLSRVN